MNIPNVGPFVVMVRPDRTDGEENSAREAPPKASERPVFPGTEPDVLEVTNIAEQVGNEDRAPAGLSRRVVDIVPYKGVHFFQSN